jgi:hypothetical protein
MSDLAVAERLLAIVRRDALLGAAANAVINGALNAWLLRGKGPHPLTLDSITGSGHTVLGSAVTLALSLGLIVGLLTVRAVRRKAAAHELALPSRGWPFGVRHALGAAATMAAYVVLVAVLWQRWAGTVTVGTPVAAGLAAAVAGATAWFVTLRMGRALIIPY